MTHVLRLSALGTRLDVRCTGERADVMAFIIEREPK